MKFLKKNGIAILLLLLLSSFVGCKPEASETPAEPSEFTVTFNAGIVNLPEVKRTFKKGESFSFMYEFNAVENYTFAGWSTKPDSKEVNFNIGDKFTVNSDVTFYAVWNKDLTMTFKAGIVKLPQKNILICEGQKYKLVSQFTDDKYILVGWSSDDGQNYKIGDEVTITKDCTFTAIWKLPEEIEDPSIVVCKIKFDAGIVNFPPVEITRVKGDKIFLESKFTDANKVLIGWNTKADGTGISYDFTDLYEIKEDITFYAVWKETGVIEPENPEDPENPISVTKINVSFDEEIIKSGDGTKDNPFILLGDENLIQVKTTFEPENAEQKIYHASNYSYDLTDDNKIYNISDLTQVLDIQFIDFNSNVESDIIYFKVVDLFTEVKIDEENVLLSLDAVDESQSVLIKPTYYSDNLKVINPYITSESWESSDSSVVSVENGKLTALKEGNAKITYKANDKEDFVRVCVVNKIIYPTSARFEDSSIIEAGIGQKTEPKVIFTPEDANIPYFLVLNGGLETESDILEIRDTKVVGKKVGRESIYIAFFKEDRKMYITQSPLTVDVKEIATDFDVVTTNDVSEIFIDINSEEPYEFFRVDTIPEDSYAEVIIESSNPEIIVTEYDKYNYPGIYKIESKSTQKEDATITVKVNHLPSKTKTIEVHAAKLPNYISLNENLLITGKTAEKQITATVYPEDSDYSEITWSSSDDDVATVIDGKITVKKNGFASITATTQSGLKASTTVLALNTSDDFTLAQDSALKIIEQGNYAGYITDNNEFIGYKYTTTGHAGVTELPENYGKWDIIGKDKDGIWKSSTYVDAGWGYKINEEIQSLNEYGFTTTSDKKLTLLVRPVLVYNKGIPYVLFVHALTNNSNETLTEQKIGVGTDIQIAGNDQAPVNVHESGAFLLDEQTNMIFSMNCLSGESVTPVDSMWIGNYSSGAMKNVYTDLKQNVSGIDSALSYSWQNIELAPGETKVFSTRLTFVVDQGGTLDAIVY